jgi:hypothetical protein
MKKIAMILFAPVLLVLMVLAQVVNLIVLGFGSIAILLDPKIPYEQYKKPALLFLIWIAILVGGFFIGVNFSSCM